MARSHASRLGQLTDTSVLRSEVRDGCSQRNFPCGIDANEAACSPRSSVKKILLLVGGELVQHVAAQLTATSRVQSEGQPNALPDEQWQAVLGLRRTPPRHAAIPWIAADLAQPASLRALPRGISHVLYAPAPQARTAADYDAVYPRGLAHLLDALGTPGALQRLVLVDSTAVWPRCEAARAEEWVDEDTPTSNTNFRSDTLLRAEALLHERLGQRGVALRLGGIYGPGRTRLITRLRGGTLVAPEGPGHWSNRIHIEDAARACGHLLNLAQPAACYIGTDGHPTQSADFYDQLADVLGVPEPRRKHRAPSGKRLSNARLVSSGWQPRWPDAIAGYRALLGLQWRA